MDNTKQCPFCKETINAEAVKCRYCKSILVEGAVSGGECGRDLPGRMISGVSVYLAKIMGISSSLVRVGFVVFTLISGPIAIAAYLAVWAFTPFKAGGPRPADRIMEELRGLIERLEKRMERPAAPEQAAVPPVHVHQEGI